MTLISTTDAAQEIGCDPATIRRICVRDSIGTRIGGSRILDRADVDRLRGIIKSSPGNPNFTVFAIAQQQSTRSKSKVIIAAEVPETPAGQTVYRVGSVLVTVS